MQKKLVKSSLALTSAVALSLGSAFAASPALADEPQELDLQNQTQVQKVLSEIDGVNAYGTSGSTLNLGVETKTAEIEDLEKQFDNITVTEGIKELTAYAGNDLVGGAGYLLDDGGRGGVCSTGFSGWDDEGNPVVLTAGHCAEITDEETGESTGATTVAETERPSTAQANGGEGFQPSGLGIVGEWGYSKYGGDPVDLDDPQQPSESDIDFGVINIDAEKYTAKNGVTDWTSADSDDLSASLATGITTVGEHTEGKIEKSGRTTGLTEGEVVPRADYDFDYTIVSGRFVHGFGVTSPGSSPFSQPGDSGGAVFQGETAVGVISGGGPMEDGTSFSWVADLDNSLEQSGVDFNLEKPGEETPEAPAAPDVKDQTIEPNGEVTGKAAPNADVKLTWAPVQGGQSAQGAPSGDDTVKADGEGNFSIEGPEAVGDYAYSAIAVVDGQESEAAEFTVTVKEAETPPPAERSIVIDPREIPASDFVKQDKGVTITVKGFDEGEEVTLEVASGPENVKGIELNETADADGVAAFSIYGTSTADPAVYVGKYEVSVTGANDTEDESALTGSFEVVADDEGKGGDGGGDLPRTGAELTGLAVGGGLLLVGGAAVVLTMRRAKKN